MAIPLSDLDIEVEYVYEREDLVTLKRETLIRVAMNYAGAVVYEGFAIIGEDDTIKLRDFQ